MAYKPILADIPYTPTLADIPKPSLLDRVADFGKQMGEAGKNTALTTVGSFLSGGRDLANLPNTLSGGKIPALAPKDPDYYYKMLGVKPNLLERIVGSVGQIPYYLVGGEGISALGKLAKLKPFLSDASGLLGSTSLMGAAANPDHPGLGAGLGLATGIAGGGGALALKGAIKTGSQKLVPLFSDIIRGKINGNHEISEAAYDKIANNYKATKANENQAWQTLANVADKTQHPFDASTYQKYLNDTANTIKANQQGQIVQQEADEPILAKINQLQNSQLTNWRQAIAHRKGINQLIGNSMQGGKSTLSDTSSKLLSRVLNKGLEGGNGIKDEFDQQILNNTNDELREPWNKANQMTQQSKVFETIGGKTGKSEPSKFYQLYSHGSPEDEKGSFIADYLPSKTNKDTAKMQQLGKMIGNQDVANHAIKTAYFKDSIQGDHTDPTLNLNSFMKKYNALSTKQRDMLFGDDEQKTITGLDRLNKMQPKKKNLGHTMGYFAAMHSPGGAIGGIAGEKIARENDIPTWLGAIMGAGAGLAGQEGLGKMIGSGYLKLRGPKNMLESLSAGKNLIKRGQIIASPTYGLKNLASTKNDD